MAEVDLARRREPEPLGAERIEGLGRADPAEERPRVRPHQREHRGQRGDVGHDRRFAGQPVPLDPVEVARRLRRSGDDEKAIEAEARDGHVALEAAALVQHRRIDHPAARDVHLVGAQALQQRERVAALQQQLGERGLVVERDRLARGLRGARDDQEAVRRLPHHREVALDAAALVEHRRVDHAARRDVHLVGAQALQDGEGVASLQQHLAERGLVVERDRLPGRALLTRVSPDDLSPAALAFSHTREQRMT